MFLLSFQLTHSNEKENSSLPFTDTLPGYKFEIPRREWSQTFAGVEYEEPPPLSPEEEMEQNEWGGRDTFTIRMLKNSHLEVVREFEKMLMKADRDERWLNAYAEDARSIDHLPEELDAKIEGRVGPPEMSLEEAKQKILRAVKKLKEIRAVKPKGDLNEEERNTIFKVDPLV